MTEPFDLIFHRIGDDWIQDVLIWRAGECYFALTHVPYDRKIIAEMGRELHPTYFGSPRVLVDDDHYRYFIIKGNRATMRKMLRAPETVFAEFVL